MKKKITVRSADGRAVPMEHNGRRYITDAVQVTSSSYYRRRIMFGELVEVPNTEKKEG